MLMWPDVRNGGAQVPASRALECKFAQECRSNLRFKRPALRMYVPSAIPPFLALTVSRLSLYLSLTPAFATITMSSSETPVTNKRRISRHSSDLPPGLPLQPLKKLREGSPESARGSDAPPSDTPLQSDDDDDVYIPSADPAASELSSLSGAELDDDDGDSDAVGAIVARTKAVAVQNRAGGAAKWDAEAKRARYIEKYGKITPEAALGECVPGCVVVNHANATSLQRNLPRLGVRPRTITSSSQ